jgi:hypothetical protein
MIGLAGLGAVAIVAIVFAVRAWETATPIDPTPTPTTSTTAAPILDTQPTVTAEAKADAKPAIAERPAANVKVEQPTTRESGTRPTASAKTVAPQSLTVLNAQLCKTLVKRGSPDWQCTAPSGELQHGTYTFYTRLLTDKTTTVEHRWLHDGRAYLVMRLRVSPVPNGGYRTFSSNSISVERAGQWKVELRAADGSILREERFVVK